MHILDLIFPKRCVGCGKFGGYFCAACRLKMRTVLLSETICPVCEKSAVAGITHPTCHTKYTVDGLTSFFHYRGAVGKAVKTLKYRFVSDIAEAFVSQVSMNALSDILYTNDRKVVFVPIPLHRERLHQRGFNQAEVLGVLVAKRLQIPMRTDILVRTRATTPQVEMKHKEDRLQNMHGVFSINQKLAHVVKDTQVILFDDVFTTGATMRAAASVLKHAGAKRVWAVTMAR